MKKKKFYSTDKMIFCAGGGIGHFAALKRNYLEENHIFETRLNFRFERVKKNQQKRLFASTWWVFKKLCVLPGSNTLAYFAATSARDKKMFYNIDKMIFCAGGGIGHFAALKQNYLEENHIFETRLNFGFQRIKKINKKIFHFAFVGIYKASFTCLARFKQTSLFYINVNVEEKNSNNTNETNFL